MKFLLKEGEIVQRVSFKFIPPVSDLKLSNNISVAQVKVIIRELNMIQLLKSLNY